MYIENAMELSLNGDTFAALKDDFNSILATTLRNMEQKSADDAVITLKLGISLEKQSSLRNKEPVELIKPTFKHDISSVMQVKNKKSCSISGDYELVWDDDEKKFVMCKITNGQMTMFDEDEEIDRYTEDAESESTIRMLPETSIEENDTQTDSTAFDWLSQFVDRKMTITEAMGNYAVRTEDDRVVLTSASSADHIFHCDAEILEKHFGHNIVCVGYGGEVLHEITIECEDCLETIFSLKVNNDVYVDDLYGEDCENSIGIDYEEDDNEGEHEDGEEDINDYDYSDPEEEE